MIWRDRSIHGVILLAWILSISNCSPVGHPPEHLTKSTSSSGNAVEKTKPPDLFKSKSDYTNPIGMEFMKIPAGSFMMGSPRSEYKGYSHDDEPVHQVTIDYSFYFGKYEVTQEQYENVMGNNPSKSDKCVDFGCCVDPKCPVELVSWREAQEFLRRLNAKDDQYKYRLPSEAEWEYACRAGTSTVFAFGDQLSSDMANFNGASPYGRAPRGPDLKKATPVGSYLPNGWGLYDMHGNVSEWCEDWYRAGYEGLPTNGAANKKRFEMYTRVHRGGAYGTSAEALRCADRNGSDPDTRWLAHGFRVVAIPKLFSCFDAGRITDWISCGPVPNAANPSTTISTSVGIVKRQSQALCQRISLLPAQRMRLRKRSCVRLTET